MTAAINDDTSTTMRGAYVYVMLNNGTTTMYRYDIAGNSWSTMAATPQASRYMGLTYNGSDDKIYVFRGNGTYDMWKYDAALNSYSGPADLVNTPGSGSDLVYYNGYIYQPRGNNTTTFYRYNISANTWQSLAAAPG
jgi:N-acetylneuraminic acid mutarotase